MYNRGMADTTGTAPHIDANYGAAPEMHINVVAPMAYASMPGRSTRFGLGDLSVGVKYRFARETSWRPQAAVYPHIGLPTGDSTQGLGAGHATLFIPVWLQKSFGPWTTYAGGGYWFNKTAAGDKDFWQGGWVLQRDLSKALTLGAEIFTFTPEDESVTSETGLNAGAIINLSDEHHILFSAGGDTNGPNTRFAYAAFQWTI